jgi:cytochrome c oxidase subunit 2
MLALSLLLFFLILFFMVLFLVRYHHSKNPVAAELKHGTMFLEAGWIIAATFLSLTMFVYGLTGFDFLRNTPGDSIPVKVFARQWSWLFQYENGKRSPELVVPVGKNIKAELSSADVIHGFYVPAFHIQQDTVPGLKTRVWFKPEAIGTYDILCTQYCGLRHSDMLAKLIVVPASDFDLWLRGGTIKFPGRTQPVFMEEGQKLLVERGCISCHSIEGSIMSGPSLKGLFGTQVKVTVKRQPKTMTTDDDYIRDSIVDPGKEIVDGYPDIMPSGRDVLSDDEIKQIIEYLKTLR